MSSSWAPSAIALGSLVLVAVLLSRARRLPALGARERGRLRRVAGLAAAVQALHFAEELSQGFAVAFPGLMGLAPLPLPAFVTFNLAWLVVWVVAATLAPRGVRAAEWPLWFLGLASVMNGVAHPVMAAVTRGYFPGLVTAIPAAAAGGVLLARLSGLSPGPER